jgi:hypothetical protein
MEQFVSGELGYGDKGLARRLADANLKERTHVREFSVFNVPPHGPFGWDTRKALSARSVPQGGRPNSDAHRRSLANPQNKQKRSTSVIVRRNSLMQVPEFTRSTMLRSTFLWLGYLRLLSRRCPDLYT